MAVQGTTAYPRAAFERQSVQTPCTCARRDARPATYRTDYLASPYRVCVCLPSVGLRATMHGQSARADNLPTELQLAYSCQTVEVGVQLSDGDVKYTIARKFLREEKTYILSCTVVYLNIYLLSLVQHAEWEERLGCTSLPPQAWILDVDMLNLALYSLGMIHWTHRHPFDLCIAVLGHDD